MMPRTNRWVANPYPHAATKTSSVLSLRCILLIYFLTINLMINDNITPTFAASTSSSSSSSVNNEQQRNMTVSTECIPSNDDYTVFHCLDGSKSKLECIDTNLECSKWASRGECTKNPQYMLIQCRNSCNSCLGLHTGVTQVAPDDDTRDEIVQKLIISQEYIFQEAERNVQALSKCINKHDLCTFWSIRGECSTNPKFMNLECSPACKSCREIVP